MQLQVNWRYMNSTRYFWGSAFGVVDVLKVLRCTKNYSHTRWNLKVTIYVTQVFAGTFMQCLVSTNEVIHSIVYWFCTNVLGLAASDLLLSDIVY